MSFFRRIWELISARRNQFGVIVLRGGGLVVIAGSAIAAARLLGTLDYSAYATATAFTAIASAGIGAGHVERAIRAGATPDQEDTLGNRAVAVVRQQMRYAPLWCVALFPIALAARVSVQTIVLIGLPLSVMVALTHTLEGFTHGAYKQVRDLVPIHLLGPTAVLGGCVIAIAFHIDVSPAGLLSWRLALLVLIALYFAHRLHMFQRPAWQPMEAGAIENLRWFAAAKLLFVIQLQSPILIAGLISTEAAGSYTAAFRSAEPIQAGAAAVAILVGPAAAAAVQSGRLSSIGGEVKQHARLGLLIAVPPTLFVLAFPRVVLGLFGDDFRDAENTLRILVISPIITTLFGPAMVFASMVKLQRDIVVAMGAAVLLQLGIAGTLLLADSLTITRVAILDVAGTVIWNTILWHRCRRSIGMTTSVV